MPARATIMGGDTPSEDSSAPFIKILRAGPTWVRDFEVDVCMLCGVHFTFTRRKHHCRMCGKIFCSDCTNHKLHIPFLNNNRARVCLLCYKQNRASKTCNRVTDVAGGNSIYCINLPFKTPAIACKSNENDDMILRDDVDPQVLLDAMMNDENSAPVSFVLNSNLVVMAKIIKILKYPGCSYWLFATQGLNVVGQEEVVVVLERDLAEDVPLDLLLHFTYIYKEASFGLHQHHMRCSEPHRGSNFGFLYLDPLKLPGPSREEDGSRRCPFEEIWKKHAFLPRNSFLVAILLKKEECSMAHLLPLRVLLKLDADQECYPYPAVSKRSRKSVCSPEDGAFLRGCSEFFDTSDCVEGLKVAVDGGRKVSLSLPRDGYNKVMRRLNFHLDVVVFFSDLDGEGGRHLSCVQEEDGLVRTILVSSDGSASDEVHVSPAGASFVVIKRSPACPCSFKVVEDGVVVELNFDLFDELKRSLRNMEGADFINGSFKVSWVDGKERINVGVTSGIDGRSFEGVRGIRTLVSPDEGGVRFLERKGPDSYFDVHCDLPTIRWLEVFFVETDIPAAYEDDFNLATFVEKVGNKCCRVFLDHILLLEGRFLMLSVRMSVRNAGEVTVDSGSSGAPLPDVCTKDLESSLSQLISESLVVRSSAQLLIVHEYLFRVVSLSSTLNGCPELIISIES